MKEDEKHETPLLVATIDRLIRQAPIDRVSAGATTELVKILGDLGLEISEMAVDMSKHARRKTVIDEDIKLAFKHWNMNENRNQQ